MISISVCLCNAQHLLEVPTYSTLPGLSNLPPSRSNFTLHDAPSSVTLLTLHWKFSNFRYSKIFFPSPSRIAPTPRRQFARTAALPHRSERQPMASDRRTMRDLTGRDADYFLFRAGVSVPEDVTHLLVDGLLQTCAVACCPILVS